MCRHGFFPIILSVFRLADRFIVHISLYSALFKSVLLWSLTTSWCIIDFAVLFYVHMSCSNECHSLLENSHDLNVPNVIGKHHLWVIKKPSLWFRAYCLSNQYEASHEVRHEFWRFYNLAHWFWCFSFRISSLSKSCLFLKILFPFLILLVFLSIPMELILLFLIS